MIVASVLLFTHYLSQKSQSLERPGILGAQAFQIETKLLHPVFGREQEKLFILAYALYLADALVVQTFVQLALIIVLLLLMYAWEPIVKGGLRRRYAIMRAIQVAGIVQLLITYASSLPASEAWLSVVYPRFLTASSMLGLTERGHVSIRLRSHLAILSLATFVAETFFVAQGIANHKDAQKAAPATASDQAPLLA